LCKKKTPSALGGPSNDLIAAAAGAKGPVLIRDGHLLEKPTRSVLERIPERVVPPALFGSVNITVDIFSIHCLSIFPVLFSPYTLGTNQ
jgi:catalase